MQKRIVIPALLPCTCESPLHLYTLVIIEVLLSIYNHLNMLNTVGTSRKLYAQSVSLISLLVKGEIRSLPSDKIVQGRNLWIIFFFFVFAF